MLFLSRETVELFVIEEVYPKALQWFASFGLVEADFKFGHTAKIVDYFYTIFKGAFNVEYLELFLIESIDDLFQELVEALFCPDHWRNNGTLHYIFRKADTDTHFLLTFLWDFIYPTEGYQAARRMIERRSKGIGYDSWDEYVEDTKDMALSLRQLYRRDKPAWNHLVRTPLKRQIGFDIGDLPSTWYQTGTPTAPTTLKDAALSVLCRDVKNRIPSPRTKRIKLQ